MKILSYCFLALAGVVFGSALAGCGENASVRLDEAERLMPSEPDSAMRIIAGLDTAELSFSLRNRKALLYLYGCAIHEMDFALDSADIVRLDKAYLGTNTDDEIRWLMIKSADAKHREDPIGRMEALKDAELLALQLGSKFDLALIYQYLANTYGDGFNGTVSRYYADKSVELLRDLDYPKQLREARMSVVRALCAARNYPAMLDSLISMEAEVASNASESYRSFFYDTLARTYGENGEPEKAMRIWHRLYDGREANSNTLAHWALDYMRLGMTDSAYAMIQQAISLPHDNTDEYLCRNVEHSILEQAGRISELHAVDSLWEIAANAVFDDRKLEQTSLTVSLRYDEATRRARLEAVNQRTRFHIAAMAVIFVILLSGCGIIYLRRRNRILRLEHENDLLRIRSLQGDLFESRSCNEAVVGRITELFRSRFDLIDSLAATYFECRETRLEQKRIYSEVKKSLSDFTTADSTARLEAIVNGYNDNLMADFRRDFPRMSQAQTRLALYLFCGFSLQSISVFTATELRNLYVYKSRLKSAVGRSQSARRADYLAFF